MTFVHTGTKQLLKDLIFAVECFSKKEKPTRIIHSPLKHDVFKRCVPLFANTVSVTTKGGGSTIHGKAALGAAFHHATQKADEGVKTGNMKVSLKHMALLELYDFCFNPEERSLIHLLSAKLGRAELDKQGRGQVHSEKVQKRSCSSSANLSMDDDTQAAKATAEQKAEADWETMRGDVLLGSGGQAASSSTALVHPA